MHYLRLYEYYPILYSAGDRYVGFYVEKVCDWASGKADMAWFGKYEDAIAWATQRAMALGVELRDDHKERLEAERAKRKPKK